MKIDFKNNAVKRGFDIVKYIDAVWSNIENRQKYVDKKAAGFFEDRETLTITIFFKNPRHRKELIVMDKPTWIWYKFFKKRNLGLL